MKVVFRCRYLVKTSTLAFLDDPYRKLLNGELQCRKTYRKRASGGRKSLAPTSKERQRAQL